MSDRLRVDEGGPLLAFLERRLQGWRRATIKERLRMGCVHVNGEATTRHDRALRPGDDVVVHAKDAGRPAGRTLGDLTALHVDEQMVAIHKPAGLLSVATDKERTHTALAIVRDALADPRPRGRTTLWPVHRLDRETSGVLLLARSREFCKALQRDWPAADKLYVAIVSGRPEPAEGLIDEPLWEDRSLQVHVGSRRGSRDARTRFRTRETGPHRSLLEIRPETGRRHQIRAHLAWLGHPIVGDKRYGVGGGRLGLHAQRLEITDPRNGQRRAFEAAPDSALLRLLRARD